MKRHKLLIVLVILGFSLGLFSLSPKAKTVSGTARNMIVQIMDSKGNILDGVRSAVSGISFPNEIVQVMNSTGTILDNLGASPATVQFSGSPGAIYFAGAMDNNVTANLTDTTNAPFTQANVGNLICVDLSSATVVAGQHVDTCGTISSVTSSSVAVLSFNNASGGAISNVMYAFGPDNSANLTTFNTALAAGTPNGITGPGKAGVNAVLPAGFYAVGSTGHIVLPNDRTTVIHGAGGGVITVPAGSVNGNVNTSSMPGTLFMMLTHSGSGAFVQAVNTTNVSTFEATNRLEDFSVMGSVGFKEHADGMCATCDGVDIVNWSDILLSHMGIWGFGRRGIYIDTQSTTTPNNVINLIEMSGDLVELNGENGIRIGGVAVGPATPTAFNLEMISIDSQSFIFGNGNNGVQVFSNVKGFTMRDSGSQGNEVTGAFPASQGEISLEGAVHGGSIEGNYIECDNANVSGIIVRTATSPTGGLQEGLYISGNSILSVSSSCFAHIFIGTDSTHLVEGLEVDSNFMAGIPSGGSCLATNGADLTDRGSWNFCQNSGTYFALPAPFAITASNYGCTASSSGQIARQTNSTAACVAGATATFAGTTPCEIVCNGTNWIQIGPGI